MTLFLGGSMSRSSFIPPGCTRRWYRGAGHRSGASPTNIDILIHAALPWDITTGGSLSGRGWINHLRVLPCRLGAGWRIFVSGLLIIKCPLTCRHSLQKWIRLWPGEYSTKRFAEREERYTRLGSIHCITTTMIKPYCKIMFENSNNKPGGTSLLSARDLISAKGRRAISYA